MDILPLYYIILYFVFGVNHQRSVYVKEFEN